MDIKTYNCYWAIIDPVGNVLERIAPNSDLGDTKTKLREYSAIYRAECKLRRRGE